MTTMTKLGTGGHVAGYDVLVLADRVLVADAAGRTWDHAVPIHGTGIGELAARPGFRLGWDRFPDGADRPEPAFRPPVAPWREPTARAADRDRPSGAGP